MSWVLRRENGDYVAPSGSHFAYTRFLEVARKYPTREAAKADACGNERVEECGC